MDTISAWMVMLIIVAAMLILFVLGTGAFFSKDGVKPSAVAAGAAIIAAVLGVIDGNQGWLAITICLSFALAGAFFTFICAGGED